MKVLTLDQNRFAEACKRLQAEVSASGFDPDVLVGIATGGDFVAKLFSHPVTLSIRRQRSLTASKRGTIGKIIRRLPRPVNNLLRIAEAALREVADRLSKPIVKTLHLPAETAHQLGQARRILVVDDAVDSGATAAAVIAAIRAASPQADIRLAVITVTRPNPLINADYALFRNRTLVRFPWSEDYANP